MSTRNRPLSPFMLGTHYRPQLTSMLSLLHRVTGVALMVGGAPIVVWWVVALGSGSESYEFLNSLASSWYGLVVLIGLLFCLCYHLLNGIRHMIWDTGYGLELKTVYLGGWLVFIASVFLTVGIIGLVLWR